MPGVLEAPDQPFGFKDQHDFDLHLALEVDRPTLDDIFARGKAAGFETRGISDHGSIDSVYFRDPNGYLIELTARTAKEHGALDCGRARRIRDEWQARKDRSEPALSSATSGVRRAEDPGAGGVVLP